MAALSDRRPDSLVSLRNVRPEQLDLILDDEINEWRQDLNWDFCASADLVRRFSGMQALDGLALLAGPRIVGYTYTVAEEGKGLIGNLYISPRYRTIQREDLLLRAALDSMWRLPGMRRIEAQLMMLTSPLERLVPDELWFRAYERYFYEASLASAADLIPKEPSAATIVPWTESRQDDAARVIAASYAGHVDSEINDQYRSASGARRFLVNIVQYPGCGNFFPAASFIAYDRASRTPCGLCMASLVASDVGHITQICVNPSHRRAGLSYELLRRSLVALAANGARSVSLTVTASNSPAIRLYERIGFVKRRRFAAYVWDRR
jgi:ribosomal protein S18 acetylase RimI-like enzyme